MQRPTPVRSAPQKATPPAASARPRAAAELDLMYAYFFPEDDKAAS